MRKSILLYALVFSALLGIYVYFSGQQMLKEKENTIEVLEQELKEVRQRVDSLHAELSADRSFSLTSNEEALSYLEDRGFNPAEIAKRVEDKLINKNHLNADNDFVPFEGMNGYFRINKIQLLNHKWLIASFTDGTYWGDLFISFEIAEDGQIELQTEKALLYPN